MKKILPFFLFATLFFSCDRPVKEPEVMVITGVAMTVPYKIIIEELSEKNLEGLKKRLSETFDEIDSLYNKWNKDSELSKINDLQKNERQPISKKLSSFLKTTSLFVELTENKFDPTIESIQDIWKESLNNHQLPDRDTLTLFSRGLGWDKIHLDGDFIYKDSSLTRIDLGGIAKGFAVDLLVDRFQELGLNNFYVEWGGEIKVKGQHPSGRPWRVFIAKLDDSNPNQAIAFINLNDGDALATSGDYLQYWTLKTDNGKELKLCHVIDPKTAQPLAITPASLCSVTVKANSCMAADAIATSLMLFPNYEEALKGIFSLDGLFPNLEVWMTSRNLLEN
ncbi:FAD:protein FMN transferase [Criblamydia sequanensis]|uniref:FAD:protein FMN transferase n=1 Tax=Candidatus Criblamydia sequanensis CRIB-18 TaxID=1437425 RepID=A0A090D0D0_9BACT|nr:FAD:protein FMN transferase [Criblamydia sequanensis]CDR34987.1 Thiamine biosynthesis lipoprotein ApbE [Criblamydia sequanensis CRIB-18]